MEAGLPADRIRLICSDVLDELGWLSAGWSVDWPISLVFGSPPYEDARSYGWLKARKGQDWVDWMVSVYRAGLAIAPMVAMVVEGRTKKFRWSATPALLMADLHRAGINLRRPCIYAKSAGICGSGGTDYFRNDFEYVIVATRKGKLPWSDKTACGHRPKWAPGGEMSYRLSSDARVNQWGHSINSGATTGDNDHVTCRGRRPSHVQNNGRRCDKLHTKRDPSDKLRLQGYTAPQIANPGNIIKCDVGGGRMGHKLAHDNEAPFALTLAERFVRSFVPPGGVVVDPFCGSGTTGHAAILHGRRFIGIDCRQSQIELTERRLLDVINNPTPSKEAKAVTSFKPTTPPTLCPKCSSILVPADKHGRCWNNATGKCEYGPLVPLTPKQRQVNKAALWAEQFPAVAFANQTNSKGEQLYRIDGRSGLWTIHGKPLRPGAKAEPGAAMLLTNRRVYVFQPNP